VGASRSPFSDIAQYRDDDGENISLKNPFYCELTALYWFWKNCHAPHVGLSHYRRYFSASDPRHIASSDDFRALTDFEVRVPPPRNYRVFSVKDQFCARLGESYWRLLEQEVGEEGGAASEALKRVGNQTALHLYNMFVMPWYLFDEYMSWLFEILERIEARLHIHPDGVDHTRILGHMGERLFNVWLVLKGDVVKPSYSSILLTERHSEWRKAAGLLVDVARWRIRGRVMDPPHSHD